MGTFDIVLLNCDFNVQVVKDRVCNFNKTVSCLTVKSSTEGNLRRC